MDPQLATRLRHLRLSGMVEALARTRRASRSRTPPAGGVSRIAGRGQASPAGRPAPRVPARTGGDSAVKELEDFDWTFHPKIPKARIVEFASAQFVDTHDRGAPDRATRPRQNARRHGHRGRGDSAGRRAFVRNTFDLAPDFAQAEATGPRRDWSTS